MAQAGMVAVLLPTAFYFLRETKKPPIEALRRAGVAVSVNTDDPAFLATDLLTEYQLCIDALGWDEATVRAVAATSLAACFTAQQRGLV